MKDAARSRTTYYDLVREYLTVNHPGLFRVLLTLTLVALVGLVVFLAADILSLGSNSVHSAPFAAIDSQGLNEGLSAATSIGAQGAKALATNGSRKENVSPAIASGSIVKTIATNDANSSRMSKTTSSRTASSSPGIGYTSGSGGGSSKQSSSKKNTAAKPSTVSSSSTASSPSDP
ncbi:MAG: hypothetical protein EHM14_13070, partial [Methanothrix sp.]